MHHIDTCTLLEIAAGHFAWYDLKYIRRNKETCTLLEIVAGHFAICVLSFIV